MITTCIMEWKYKFEISKFFSISTKTQGSKRKSPNTPVSSPNKKQKNAAGFYIIFFTNTCTLCQL